MDLTDVSLLLKTPMNPTTGYGKDGIYLAKYFQSHSRADVNLEPKYVGIPIDREVVPLFAKPRPSGFKIALNHEYPGELGFSEQMPSFADYVVGWTMYEFNSFGNDNSMAKELKERLECFDLVLVYDEVSKQALAEYMPNDLDRLKVLQGGYDADFWKPTEQELAERDWDNGPFRFCMNGTANLRKNPWPVLQAFRELKDIHGDDFDAELHLKTTSLVFPPVLEEWAKGLKIHYAIWSDEDMKKFYSKMHCLFAPSWGEGKNLPALEMQTMGGVAAVSAIGGHMQWADPEWAYLMHGPIEEHEPRMGSMRIGMETCMETMWHIYTHRAEAKEKAYKASQLIPQMCDWTKVLDRFAQIIDTVPAKSRS